MFEATRTRQAPCDETEGLTLETSTEIPSPSAQAYLDLMKPEPGTTFESVTYPGHVYTLLHSDEVRLKFLALACHRSLTAKPGQVFQMLRTTFHFACETGQIVRIA